MPAPKFKLIDLKPFLQRAVSLTEQEFPGTAVALRVEPDDLILHADENLVFQVVVNLLRNAVQSGAGRIEVSAELSVGEQVAIRVADNGSGIQPEILSHIFIPFFTTREQGSGIGLSLSRQIMRGHGGSITVHSQPGKTVFSLLFP